MGPQTKEEGSQEVWQSHDAEGSPLQAWHMVFLTPRGTPTSSCNDVDK